MEFIFKEEKMLFLYGIKNGLIHFFEKNLIENLRHVYYGGVPASIILLSRVLCGGYCYDRSLLITLGFDEDDDFKLVNGTIDGIKLSPYYIDNNSRNFDGTPNIHYGNHSFAERKTKDGRVFVYDTTIGLVIEKNLYYKIENPKINKINDKKAIFDFFEYQDIKHSNLENDKYILPLILPKIESTIEEEYLCKELLKEEIERLKKEIEYDGICKEIEEDMKAKLYKR